MTRYSVVIAQLATSGSQCPGRAPSILGPSLRPGSRREQQAALFRRSPRISRPAPSPSNRLSSHLSPDLVSPPISTPYLSPHLTFPGRRLSVPARRLFACLAVYPSVCFTFPALASSFRTRPRPTPGSVSCILGASTRVPAFSPLHLSSPRAPRLPHPCLTLCAPRSRRMHAASSLQMHPLSAPRDEPSRVSALGGVPSALSTCTLDVHSLRCPSRRARRMDAAGVAKKVESRGRHRTALEVGGRVLLSAFCTKIDIDTRSWLSDWASFSRYWAASVARERRGQGEGEWEWEEGRERWKDDRDDVRQGPQRYVSSAWLYGGGTAPSILHPPPSRLGMEERFSAVVLLAESKEGGGSWITAGGNADVGAGFALAQRERQWMISPAEGGWRVGRSLRRDGMAAAAGLTAQESVGPCVSVSPVPLDVRARGTRMPRLLSEGRSGFAIEQQEEDEDEGLMLDSGEHFSGLEWVGDASGMWMWKARWSGAEGGGAKIGAPWFVVERGRG
ncbi:hypothetical protein B0H11DRAFT_1926567 [Mycena galericulata]|nr:hypothetical protein B0H11DRAFT_1926567 [Mycena galericulata]